MVRNPMVSWEQLEAMVDFMEKDIDFATGRLSRRELGKRERRRKWENLTMILNTSNFGPKKSPLRWRLFWNDKKYAVRKKIARIENSLNPSKETLDTMEKRILKIIGSLDKDDDALDRPKRRSSRAIKVTVSPLRVPMSPDASSSSIEDKFDPSPPDGAELRPSPGIRKKRFDKNLRPLTVRPPEWLRKMEERRLAIDERNCASFATMAEQVTQIRHLLETIANK